MDSTSLEAVLDRVSIALDMLCKQQHYNLSYKNCVRYNNLAQDQIKFLKQHLG